MTTVNPYCSIPGKEVKINALLHKHTTKLFKHSAEPFKLLAKLLVFKSF